MLVLDKRLPEARKQFEAVLAANPGNTEVIYAVGLLAFQLKDYAVAEENMKRLLAMGYRDRERGALSPRADRRGAEAMAAGGAVVRAISDGDQLMPARMRTANAHRQAGQARRGAQLPAARRCRRTRRSRRSSSSPRRSSCARRKRNQDAFELLGEALQKEPDQPELLYDYALTAEKLDRFDVLEANLRKLIEVRPDHAHAYNALGYSFAERNLRLPEARKLIESALEISPEDYFIIDSLGWVLYREGDLKGAAEQLRRAYGGRPDAEIGAHLGEVLWVIGRARRGEAHLAGSRSSPVPTTRPCRRPSSACRR